MLQCITLIRDNGSQLGNGILLKAYRQRQDIGCGSYYELHLVGFDLIATRLISQVYHTF